MKKSIIALFATVALAGSAFAGSTYVSSGKETKDYKPYEEPFTCFSDQEFQLDLFGSYTNTEPGGYGDGFGGGIALNYFFVRNVGIGVDGNVFDGKQNGVWNTTSSLIVRFPIDSACLAPYIFGGGGYQVDGAGRGTIHAGGGLEYRIVPNRIGLFVEGRYTWAVNSTNDSTQVRSGIRIVF